ncbi:hypothetical protein SAMN02799631_01865 [Methylobacterium sp. 174MFSha1.1]|nr:hypothetical protein SAMN02799631_01865 [Methylobacterium sp. 174MFSha1.1]
MCDSFQVATGLPRARLHGRGVRIHNPGPASILAGNPRGAIHRCQFFSQTRRHQSLYNGTRATLLGKFWNDQPDLADHVDVGLVRTIGVPPTKGRDRYPLLFPVADSPVPTAPQAENDGKRSLVVACRAVLPALPTVPRATLLGADTILRTLPSLARLHRVIDGYEVPTRAGQLRILRDLKRLGEVIAVEVHHDRVGIVKRVSLRQVLLRPRYDAGSRVPAKGRPLQSEQRLDASQDHLSVKGLPNVSRTSNDALAFVDDLHDPRAKAQMCLVIIVIRSMTMLRNSHPVGPRALWRIFEYTEVQVDRDHSFRLQDELFCVKH